MFKKCRRCTAEFETDEARRTVCDVCNPPSERAKQNAIARRRAALWHAWKDIAPIAEDFRPELLALAGDMVLMREREKSPSTGSLVGALKALSRTSGREGTRGGLIRVASIALTLARRLR